MREAIVHFVGPFGWSRGAPIPCIYDVPVGRQRGIYLYSVPTPEGDELVRYVGQTGTSFTQRSGGTSEAGCLVSTGCMIQIS
jgi:hypothetical protein